MKWRDLLAHAHPNFPPLSSAVEAPLFIGSGGGGMTWRDLLAHVHPIFPPLFFFCNGGGVEWRGFVRMRMKFEWRAIL